MAERVAEARERGGFLYAGVDARGRDLWDYVRTDVDGVSHRLIAVGSVAWSCNCLDAQRQKARGVASPICKHQILLREELSQATKAMDATPTRVPCPDCKDREIWSSWARCQWCQDDIDEGVRPLHVRGN